MKFRCLLSAALLVVSTAACGSSEGPTDERSSAPGATAEPSGNSPKIELNSDMLNAYERGIRKEAEAVRLAQRRSSEAKTAQERGEAIQASFEHATIPLGAEAAGLDVDRYRVLRDTINEIFRTLDIQGKIDGPISMDFSRVDDATKQRLARDPFSDLPAGSAEALRNHMDRLVPAWIEYVNLTAVAG